MGSIVAALMLHSEGMTTVEAAALVVCQIVDMLVLQSEGTLVVEAVAFGEDLGIPAADFEAVLLSVAGSQEGGEQHPCFQMKMVVGSVARDLDPVW